ncbi:mitochondrial 54S ribosomal protein YmL7/YmL5 [Aspergillus arachidicola]|uniref:Large ribosomal subunit protein uL5m n=1 Tax=Aspergillus arachidicola TaxID=656916 RepID=A0A2G7FSL7_9EURO|nr:mitochondrial 54S ribosomal protein YmL7/YmL5 [Aspergillus arachidicola]
MAASEPSRYLARSLPRAFVPTARPQGFCLRRNVSDQASSKAAPADLNELESATSLTSTTLSEATAKSFDPIARTKARKKQLPRSRYQFRSPKYDRGPLHPHQPLRRLIPLPDSMFRVPSLFPDSPYHKNRPLRGPRGGDVLRLLRKPINFNNVPQLERITIHSYVKQAAQENSSWLHVAGMAVQAISNARVETFKSKTSVATWSIAPGRDTVAVKAELRGEDMLHFFGKLVDVVMPRIKDWEGVKGTSGDSSGNITFGLEPENVALFPEIEVNYDMYPPKMIPGCHITIHTSAKTDKDARLLLSAMGIPFYGKMVD